jgi:hypothetical protein
VATEHHSIPPFAWCFETLPRLIARSRIRTTGGALGTRISTGLGDNWRDGERDPVEEVPLDGEIVESGRRARSRVETPALANGIEDAEVIEEDMAGVPARRVSVGVWHTPRSAINACARRSSGRSVGRIYEIASGGRPRVLRRAGVRAARRLAFARPDALAWLVEESCARRLTMRARPLFAPCTRDISLEERMSAVL